MCGGGDGGGGSDAEDNVGGDGAPGRGDADDASSWCWWGYLTLKAYFRTGDDDLILLQP